MQVAAYRSLPNAVCHKAKRLHNRDCSSYLESRVQPSRVRMGFVCRASEEDESVDKGRESSSDEGDAALQDSLINIINFEIGKKKVIDDHVEESGNKLRGIAEEAKEEMEKATELTKLRGDLAFDSALADIYKEADKFERKLKKSREELESRNNELSAWEQDLADSRNEGQFFKSLYKADNEKDGEKKRSRFEDEDGERIRLRARQVVKPAEDEVRSPARLYIFALLGSVLVIDIVADVVSDAPSVGFDTFYGVLAAFALYLAVNEQAALLKSQDKRE